MMFKIALTTFVVLMPNLSAMKLPPLQKAEQTTARNISLFETVLSQLPPDLVPTSAQTIAEPQGSSIDPLEVLLEMHEVSAKFEWLSKLCSLRIPYDPEWEKMNSDQLQLLYSMHKSILKMQEALRHLRFYREDM